MLFADNASFNQLLFICTKKKKHKGTEKMDIDVSFPIKHLSNDSTLYIFN